MIINICEIIFILFLFKVFVFLIWFLGIIKKCVGVFGFIL